MDARLDTLFTELYQVNIHVGRIAWRQTVVGGFISKTSPSPTLEVSKAEDEDDDDDATTFEDNMMEMLAHPVQIRCLLDTLNLCHSWQKGEVVLDIRVVILRGGVSIGPFC